MNDGSPAPDFSDNQSINDAIDSVQGFIHDLENAAVEATRQTVESAVGGNPAASTTAAASTAPAGSDSSVGTYLLLGTVVVAFGVVVWFAFRPRKS